MAKKLYRSKTDRVFFGVCGGLADYFEIDAVIVRLIVVLIALAGGFGVLFYLLAALIIPEETGIEEAKLAGKKKTDKTEEFTKKAEAAAQQVASEAKKKMNQGKGSQIFGLVLIALGVFFMLEMVFPWFDFGNFWWLILIAIGLVLLFGGRKE